jgi:hypothetical protein
MPFEKKNNDTSELKNTHISHAHLNNFPKHYVFSVQPMGQDSSYKELTAVGVFSCVGHGQPASSVMLEIKVFIFKAIAIDRAASSS